MICPRAQLTVHHLAERWRSQTTANNTLSIASSFVFTLEAVPITIRDLVHARLEAVRVITPVATVAQQQLVLGLSRLTELTIRLHDALVPGDARFQHVQCHRKLGGSDGSFYCVAP